MPDGICICLLFNGLLGVIREDSGLVARVVEDLGIDLGKVRQEVERLVSRGTGAVTWDRLPLTPWGRKAIEHAGEEARTLGYEEVGTEHLLLGLLVATEGVAIAILQNFGIPAREVCERLRNLLRKGR